jgi:hypothetical protein
VLLVSVHEVSMKYTLVDGDAARGDQRIVALQIAIGF